jgi:hypothetical protein
MQLKSFLVACGAPLASLAAVALLATRTLAGPPFFTDDPVPDDKGHGEFYVGAMETWARGGVFGELPLFEYDYSPIDNLQLHMITPLVYDRDNQSETINYGYGDTELGIKFRFIQEDSLFPGCPQVATFPLLEMPSGDVHRGLGNGRLQEFVPIWMQKSWGPQNRQWTLYGGGGYEVNHGAGNENFGFFGAVLQKQVADNLALAGEVFHFTPAADGQSSHTGFNVGFIYDFSDNWHFLFSIGRDFVGDNRLTNYNAIQLTF